MHQGRRSMGSHKHGVSGHAGKGPKLRQYLKRLAEQNERRRRKARLYGSVRELFTNVRPR